MRYGFFSNMVTWLLIVLFVYTALNKLADHSFFLAQLHFYPLIHSSANFISWIIPCAELLVASLLFFPSSRKTGLIGSLTLLLIFTSYLIMMIIYSPDLPCSCGGVIASLSWKQHIVFNVVFSTLTLLAILSNKRAQHLGVYSNKT